MRTTTETSYQLSPRVTLVPGDRFRVSGGPYYRLAGGQRVPMAARGVMTFLAAHRRGQRVTIEARDSGGATVLLHTAGRRRSPVPGLVPRPYRIARIGKRLKA